MNGNVGIGTWNPVQKLDVTGTINATTMTEGGIAVLNNDEMDSSSELLAIMDDETGTGLLVFGTTPTIATPVLTGNVGVGTTAPVGGLIVMTGNVGIGTWSPIGKLEVKGGPALIGSGTNTNATASGELYVEADLEVDGTIYGDGSGITALPAGLAAGGWTDFGTDVGLSLTSDIVGIGTTDPDAALEIVESGEAPLMISLAPTGNGDLLIVNSIGSVGMSSIFRIRTCQ